jgi:hypothetical protein
MNSIGEEKKSREIEADQKRHVALAASPVQEKEIAGIDLSQIEQTPAEGSRREQDLAGSDLSQIEETPAERRVREQEPAQADGQDLLKVTSASCQKNMVVMTDIVHTVEHAYAKSLQPVEQTKISQEQQCDQVKVTTDHGAPLQEDEHVEGLMQVVQSQQGQQQDGGLEAHVEQSQQGQLDGGLEDHVEQSQQGEQDEGLEDHVEKSQQGEQDGDLGYVVQSQQSEQSGGLTYMVQSQQGVLTHVMQASTYREI